MILMTRYFIVLYAVSHLILMLLLSWLHNGYCPRIFLSIIFSDEMIPQLPHILISLSIIALNHIRKIILQHSTGYSEAMGLEGPDSTPGASGIPGMYCSPSYKYAMLGDGILFGLCVFTKPKIYKRLFTRCIFFVFFVGFVPLS